MAKMAGGVRAQPPCKDIDTINGPQKRAKLRGIMTSSKIVTAIRDDYVLLLLTPKVVLLLLVCNDSIANYDAKSN